MESTCHEYSLKCESKVTEHSSCSCSYCKGQNILGETSQYSCSTYNNDESDETLHLAPTNPALIHREPCREELTLSNMKRVSSNIVYPQSEARRKKRERNNLAILFNNHILLLRIFISWARYVLSFQRRKSKSLLRKVFLIWREKAQVGVDRLRALQKLRFVNYQFQCRNLRWMAWKQWNYIVQTYLKVLSCFLGWKKVMKIETRNSKKRKRKINLKRCMRIWREKSEKSVLWRYSINHQRLNLTKYTFHAWRNYNTKRRTKIRMIKHGWKIWNRKRRLRILSRVLCAWKEILCRAKRECSFIVSISNVIRNNLVRYWSKKWIQENRLHMLIHKLHIHLLAIQHKNRQYFWHQWRINHKLAIKREKFFVAVVFNRWAGYIDFVIHRKRKRDLALSYWAEKICCKTFKEWYTITQMKKNRLKSNGSIENYSPFQSNNLDTSFYDRSIDTISNDSLRHNHLPNFLMNTSFQFDRSSLGPHRQLPLHTEERQFYDQSLCEERLKQIVNSNQTNTLNADCMPLPDEIRPLHELMSNTIIRANDNFGEKNTSLESSTTSYISRSQIPSWISNELREKFKFEEEDIVAQKKHCEENNIHTKSIFDFPEENETNKSYENQLLYPNNKIYGAIAPESTDISDIHCLREETIADLSSLQITTDEGPSTKNQDCENMCQMKLYDRKDESKNKSIFHSPFSTDTISDVEENLTHLKESLLQIAHAKKIAKSQGEITLEIWKQKYKSRLLQISQEMRELKKMREDYIIAKCKNSDLP